MDSSNAELYGKGIFTTIAVRDSTPLFWEKHWARLTRDSERVGIDMSAFSEAHVARELEQSLRNDGVIGGRARITFLDNRAGEKWPAAAGVATKMSILTARRKSLPLKFSLTTSPYRVNSRSPLVGVKSCNYLENLLSIEEARGRGFDEAIRVNDQGEIAGGCMSNIFWLKDSKLFTPHLDTGCLPGTTREYILENLPCEETREPIDTLNDVEAIFMTSAGLGIVRVCDLDGRSIGEIDHPILHLLK